MNLLQKYKWYFLVGILAEVFIFLFSYFMYKENWAEVFRHAARYSGRLSFFVYVYCVYSFISEAKLKATEQTKVNALVFLVLHYIHLGFLLTNLYLNNIEIAIPRLSGGIIAYLMILIYPFILHKLKTALHLVYYYYVGLLMLLTFAARAAGKFEGVQPSVFHYAGIAAVIGLFVWMAVVYKKTSFTKAT
jgi:hypothetical protein